MRELERRLQAAAECARHANWPGYADALGAVRDALAQHPVCSKDAGLQRHLDTLAAAAPQHDPEGCIQEIEALLQALRERCTGETFELRAPSEAPPVDLRGLQPPEPIVRILEALERAPRTPLRVILPHEPLPLYGLLRERGFSFSGAPRADGAFEVRIERSS